MELKSFSALAASFAAGIALCGCATEPQYYASPYVNAAPAFTAVAGPDGQIAVVGNAQGPQGYVVVQQQGYSGAPRYPYGYNGSNPGNVCSGLNAGTLVGAGLGYAAGSQVWNRRDRKGAEIVGALVGASVGTRAGNGCR